MKKHLLLLIVPLLFVNSCEEEESDNDISSICGNVSIEINGESREYNPNEAMCGVYTTVMNTSVGVGVAVLFNSGCDNGNLDYMVGVSLNDLYGTNSWSFTSGTSGLSNCNPGGGWDFTYYEGSGTIDNINYETRTIDGSFYLPPGNNGKPEIQCSFSNVPF